jgi:hypothetical protein
MRSGAAAAATTRSFLRGVHSVKGVERCIADAGTFSSTSISGSLDAGDGVRDEVWERYAAAHEQVALHVCELAAAGTDTTAQLIANADRRPSSSAPRTSTWRSRAS